MSTELQAAKERILQLSTLIEVSKIVTSTLVLDEVLTLVMELSGKVVKAQASSLILVDEERNELVFRVALGKKGEDIKQISLPYGTGIAGWVIANEKPLLVDDVTKDERFYRGVDESTGFKTNCVLCVPLKAKDKIFGAIEAINKVDGSFTQGDLELLYGFANQAAIAIDNARLYKNIEELFLSTIRSLAAAIDAKDPYTHGHSERVREYSLAIATELGLTQREKERVALSALLHDIGKIGVDESVLRKPTRLTEEEFEQIKKHPSLGAKIIRPIKELENLIPGVYQHHERYDGKGYPSGLGRESISLAGKIIAVADAFDAMVSDRPYRKGMNPEEALEKIKGQAGVQFDPKVVKAFIKIYTRNK